MAPIENPRKNTNDVSSDTLGPSSAQVSLSILVVLTWAYLLAGQIICYVSLARLVLGAHRRLLEASGVACLS